MHMNKLKNVAHNYRKITMLDKILMLSSIGFGLLYLLGFFWFSGDALSVSKVKYFLLLSPGFSLVFSQLLYNSSIRKKTGVFLILLVILIGLCGSVFGIFSSFDSAGFLSDQLMILFQYGTIITILLFIGYKYVKDKSDT